MSLHQKRTHPRYVEGCWACRIGDGPTVSYCNSAAGKDATVQKKWDASLERYRQSVMAGNEPESTTPAAVLAADDWSQRTGKAYSAEAYQASKTAALKEMAD